MLSAVPKESPMASIRSYVVRIYRSGRTGMTGVVEDVRTGRVDRDGHSVR